MSFDDYMTKSELAFYDIGLSDFAPWAETSQDSQQVVYEDFRLEASSHLRCDHTAGDQSQLSVINDHLCDIPAFSPEDMENIRRYAGGGGAPQKAFIRDCRASYQRMLCDPREQQLDGFGEWEFLNLLGNVLAGEARDVHTAFMEEWDFQSVTNPNREEALRMENIRHLWRIYRRDRTAYLTL